MTPSLHGREPYDSADDAALDALLYAADDAVRVELDGAVNLDEGRAMIFATSITPDQEPVPHFLRTPGPDPMDQPPLVPASFQAPDHEVHSESSEIRPDSAAAPQPDTAPRHDRARHHDESVTRPQPR